MIALQKPLENGADHAVVLDSTLFYPEGGGQEADRGDLTQEETGVRALTRKSRERWFSTSPTGRLPKESVSKEPLIGTGESNSWIITQRCTLLVELHESCSARISFKQVRIFPKTAGDSILRITTA